MNLEDKEALYREIKQHIAPLLAGEHDEIAVMATIVAELKHSLPYCDWAGFYRVVQPGLLKIGPYQGGHGCVTIPFERGVCGKCAREKRTQIIPDVQAISYHIACSSSTRSEIVVPVVDAKGELRTVLDLDSDSPAAFDQVDQKELENLVSVFGQVYGPASAYA